MAIIPLTRGYEAIVDEADVEWLSNYVWWVNFGSVHPRAMGHIDGRHWYMHRFILNAPKGSDVDHVNRNALDNRRENLRVATRAQNNGNAVPPKQWRGRPCSSRFKGASWMPKKNKWQAGGHVDDRRIALGHYDTEEAAARAYDAWAREYFGEFARLNFPNET